MIRFLSKFRVSFSLCHSTNHVSYERTVLTARGLSLPGNPIPHASVNVRISGVHEKVLETDFCLSSNPIWNENSPRSDIHSQRRLFTYKTLECLSRREPWSHLSLNIDIPINFASLLLQHRHSFQYNNFLNVSKIKEQTKVTFPHVNLFV
jgi:hypothetical protein